MKTEFSVLITQIEYLSLKINITFYNQPNNDSLSPYLQRFVLKKKIKNNFLINSNIFFMNFDWKNY